MLTHQQQASSCQRERGGFTLVELLIVIAIISILMTIGAVGIGNLSGGKSISTATATTEAYFEEARSLALTNHSRVRVLVDVNNPKNANTYLKRIVIAYEKSDENGQPVTDEWMLLNKGLTLPDGIYFSRDYSVKDIQGTGGELETQSLSGEGIKNDYQGEYVYYEFNGEGVCTAPGSSFVIGTGARSPGDEKPRVVGTAKRDFGGFVIWRNGRTSIIKSPDQIDVKESQKTF